MRDYGTVPRGVVSQADVLLGPWGGSAAGTLPAIHNLIGEHEALRDALQVVVHALQFSNESQTHRDLAEPCGIDACVMCWALGTAEKALATTSERKAAS